MAPGHAREVLSYLKEDAEAPWDFLASLHACDYLPEEPRLGVHWQLLSTARRDRLGVRTRVRVEDPHVPTVMDLWPTADFQEKEAYDFYGVIFEGHEGLRRILMPEDYEGHPLRRDFPIGGEPVLFSYNENKLPVWYE
ncbi:MAG: NADH-quinone oxidoreductase subunit C [Actinomycetota bacterium]|nr:NADH-quinone oxidoreductase subunit C [Actinomycetota bacterium]